MVKYRPQDVSVRTTGWAGTDDLDVQKKRPEIKYLDGMGIFLFCIETTNINFSSLTVHNFFKSSVLPL